MEKIPLVPLDHAWQARACGVDVRHHVDLPIPLPDIVIARGRPIVIAIEVQDAGIGTKQIDLAEFSLGLGDHGCDSLFVAHIQCDAVAAQFRSQILCGVGVEICDHQTADALLAEAPTQAGADAAGAACNDNDFVPQLHAQAA